MKYPNNVVRVCVDETGGYDAAGRFYSKLAGTEQTFCSIANLLIRADQMMDERGGPQSFQVKRSFQKNTPEAGRIQEIRDGESEEQIKDEEMENKYGSCATFDFVVQSRMHASWQGFLRDGDGSWLGDFESELQLMQLMAEALYRKVNSDPQVTEK